MAKDIEEFLKMAAQRRRDAAARAQTTPPAAPPPTPAQPAQPVQRKPSKKTRQPPVILGEDDVEVIPPRRESVSKHVQQHINTGRIKQRVRRLGAEVGQADEKLEARLHDTFDHQVGHLTQPSISPDDSVAQGKAASRARQAQLAFLSSPQNLRQAIILSEILQRPNWDKDF
jgi:hypothetical protein